MKKRILMIEDDEEMCRELRLILEEEGYSVRERYNGRTGIDSLKKNKPDLVLLDLKMPELSGYDVLHYRDRYYPSIPVIILTGSPLPDDCIEEKQHYAGLESARHVFGKPFDIPQLLKMIASIL